MNQIKKMTGKGHTLYEYDLPKNNIDVWVLVAERCYEISKTLLAENTYAKEIIFSISEYDYSLSNGVFGITPDGYLRYPTEIYKIIYDDEKSHHLINKNFEKIRRVQVRVKCQPYILPLFYENSKIEQQFGLLEKIRNKLHIPDIVGNGLEGLRYNRITTYTPKRSEEIKRAFKLLALKPKLKMFLDILAENCYWHRAV
jgi:hypothetical protein